MPGFEFAWRYDGASIGSPLEAEEILGYSLTGSSAIYEGDLLASSTFSGVSLNSVPSLRRLLAADKTAQYGGVSVLAAPAATGLLSAVTAATFNEPFLANGTYFVQLTYVSATGETVGGTSASQATAGGTQAILVAAPAGVAGAVGYKVYASAVGTTTPFFLQSGVVGFGNNFVIGGTGASNALNVLGPNPPSANTSGKIAGIIGVAPYQVITSAAGVATGGAAPGFGNISYQFQSMPQGVPIEPITGSSLYQYYSTSSQNVFKAALDSTSAIASPTINNTLAGIILTTTNGITTYTVDTNAGAGFQVLRILRCEEVDPLYGFHGGPVYVQFVGTYQQGATAIQYTAQ